MMRAFRFCVTILLCCGFWTPAVQGGVKFSFCEMLAQQRVEDALLARGLALAGADVEERAEYGLVPLHMAANAETVAALLDCGANPYALTLAGRSALHYAPDVASLELLVTAGLDVRQKDIFGESALFFAKDAVCAAWLIAKMKEAGEDPKVFLNERAKADWTALHALTWTRDSAASKDWQAVRDAWLASMPNVTAEEAAPYRARLNDFTPEAMLRVLLPAGADVNARDWQGRTVAFYAGGMEARELLKEYGADFTATDDEGQTPLTIPWRHEQKSPEVVRFLIAEGADVNHITEDGDSPLACPCIRTAESLRVLLEAGADPNLAARVGGRTEIPLLFHTEPECVRLLLEAGADVHARDRRGRTTLHFTQRSSELGQQQERVRLLLEAGADANARDNDGWTPLFYVAGNPEIMKMLLDAGADVNARDNAGQTVAQARILRMNVDGIKLLVEAGMELKPAANGKTLLHTVTDMDVLRYLIAQGLDVNAQDRGGRTPLFRNEYDAKWPEMARLLLEAGTDVNVRDKNGQTCLFGCLSSVVAPLLEAGADVHVVDNEGRQPLHLCRSAGCVKLLLKAGADVNARDNLLRTPLHMTVRTDRRRTQALLEGGADASAVDASGMTPIFHIMYDTGTAYLLLEYGADVNAADVNLRTTLHRMADIQFTAPWLLKNGADPNLPDINGRTPLFGVSDRKIYQLFLEAGANPHHRDKDGNLADCVTLYGADGKKFVAEESEDDFSDDEDDELYFCGAPLRPEEVMEEFMRAEAWKRGVFQGDEPYLPEWMFEVETGGGLFGADF